MASVRSQSFAELRLEPRADVRWSRRTERGVELILAVDPLAEKQWFWRPEEWFVWESLAPARTRKQLRAAWEERFAPKRISPDALQRILGRLLAAGLVRPLDAATEETLARRMESAARSRGAWWRHILALRGPGFSPQALQQSLRPLARSIFTLPCALALITLTVIAIWTALTHSTRLRIESAAIVIPDGWRGIAGWLLVLAGVKAWHESGHLLAATAFGVRARRLGTMLLCGVPTLYCTVDDAWRAPKRARLLIDAGGILFELALACAAIFVWGATGPGVWHDTALRIAILSGVNTLLLNGNPLLRYDGYFLLTDATGIPNLAEQAGALARRTFAQALGADDPALRDPPLQHHPAATRAWLTIYAIASTAYRWVLAWGLVWFVDQSLKPLGWTTPARLLGVVFLTLFAIPLMMLTRNAAQVFVHADDSRRRRVGRRAIIGGGLIAALLFIPWPATVELPILWESPDAQPLAATVAGNLLEAKPPGSSVAADEAVFVLENPELEQRLSKAAGEVVRAAAHLENLQRRRNDPTAATELPTAESALADAKSRAEELRREQARLTIRAAQAGRLIAPRTRGETETRLTESGEALLAPVAVADWDGRPGDARNRGAWIEVGTPLGSIVDPQRREAWALLEQFDVGTIRVGQTAELRSRAEPGKQWTGEVLEIAALPAAAVSPEWIELDPTRLRASDATDRNREEAAAPRTTSYYARIRLDDAPTTPLLGSVGTARVRIAPRSLFARGGDWFTRTFGWNW